MIENFPMEEREPGVYYATYRIKLQDRLPYGRLVGHLHSKMGTTSQWVDILGPVTIGEPTVLPPVISQDRLLKSSNSPYLVEDGLVVMPGVKLTIGPGSVLWFRKSGVVVKGELQIMGTSANPVRMASMGLNGWKGILLDHSQANNNISYCTISNAEFGFKATNSKVTIEHVLLQDNTWGIVLDETSAEIENSLIRTSAKTGISARNSQLMVKGSTISENGFGGLLLVKSQIQLEQNNILNNSDWAIKAVESQEPIQAPYNWWGNEDTNPDEMIIGPVEIQPMLEKPVAIQMVE